MSPRLYIDVFDFSIISETDDWIVVNKPAPLQIHPSKPGGAPTLWHGLRQLLSYELVNGGQLSMINRLDRETSGLVLVAKHQRSARELHKAMMRREVTKEYLAIVHGWPEEDTFTVDAPILRKGEVENSSVYLLQKVHPDGKSAQTGFRVLARFERETAAGRKFALLAAVPYTGRTHQIRIHASHVGHPVVGDKLYGPGPEWYLRQISCGWTPEAAAVLLLPRHALHSRLMGITTEDGTSLQWTAPLFSDMLSFLTPEAAAAVPGE